jgi:hypothetical protein
MDYSKRLQISILGNSKTEFTTGDRTKLAKGYERIVIGDRGPYIEFVKDQILLENMYIPEVETKRLNNNIYYYIEYRSNDSSNVKIYYQKKLVSYADYKIGLFYISPFDLLADGKIIIDKIKK